MSSAFHGCGCGLATCGCCAGVEAFTPRPIDNRPGLSTLSVRVGRHGDFLAALQARLSSHRLPEGGAPLARLRTRDRDDPSIALLDAFAVASDVLTFYNERIANEGYLRTATEFRSVQELARLVGYTPRPGVAAGTYLAFTLDAAPATPVTIAKGMRVQSVPAQDQLPQSFETSEDLAARTEWNRLGLRVTAPQQFAGQAGKLYLAGAATGLKPGDALLLGVADAKPLPARVLSIDADAKADRTMVTLESWLPIGLADRELTRLIANPPGGIVAPTIAASAAEFQMARTSEVAALAADLKAQIHTARDSLGGLPQTALRGWLEAVEKRVDVLAARSHALAADAERSDDEDQSLIAQLATKPSVPPASAARLARQTSTSFAPGSGATLQMLGAAAPAVGANYADALKADRTAAPPLLLKVYALRTRAGLFGRVFPKRSQTTRRGDGTFETHEIGEWPIGTVGRVDTRREDPATVTLDAAYEGIAPGSWIMVDMSSVPISQAQWIVRQIDRVVVASVAAVDAKRARADYGGSGDSTALRLGAGAKWIEYKEANDDNNPVGDQATIDREFQLIRRTAVYARSELLPLAEAPIETPLCIEDVDDAIELDGLYAGLEPGRYVVVSGERADIAGTEGVQAQEVAMIARVVHGLRGTTADVTPAAARGPALAGDRIHTFIWFARPLAYCYRRDKVTIYGNVVQATHGETRTESLGDGDAATPNQRFVLKQQPLTFVSAATARGAVSTVQVLVNDIRWRETDQLIDAGPADRQYMLHSGPDGRAEVIFGDGHEGARPPTGAQNIRAIYRTGIGRPGNVAVGQISQLATRPLGVREAINPVAATGGADPESRDQARRNAPLTTMALDRLVSVRDHADFARTFAGVAKADARLLSDGRRRFVHVTIAAEGDAPLDATTSLVTNLKRALGVLGDPYQPVIVQPRELALLIVAARLAIDPARVWETVYAAARARLLDLFGFERRNLAQGLAASELVAALQAVPGVAYVDLDVFGRVATHEGPPDRRLPLPPEAFSAAAIAIAGDRVFPSLESLPARREGGGLLPAELLVLSPDVPATLILNEIP